MAISFTPWTHIILPSRAAPDSDQHIFVRFSGHRLLFLIIVMIWSGDNDFHRPVTVGSIHHWFRKIAS